MNTRTGLAVAFAIAICFGLYLADRAIAQLNARSDIGVVKVRQSKAEAEQAVAVATGGADSQVQAARGRMESAKADAEALLTETGARAKANRMLTETITDALLRYKAIETWDGVLPTVTSGAIPFVQVPTGK